MSLPPTVSRKKLSGDKLPVLGSHTVTADKVLSFIMPGVRFGARVSGTSRVDAKIDTGGNYFLISLHNISQDKVKEYDLNFSSSSSHHGVGHLHWICLARNLDPQHTYDIRVYKKTEPKIKSIFSRFHPCRVKELRLTRYSQTQPAEDPIFHPMSSADFFCPQGGYIEVIGDSDVCGFGVDGEISSPMNVLTMDGSTQDCMKAWGSWLAKELGFNNNFVCTGWSGKGIVRNAPMCGDKTLPDVWYSHIPSRDLPVSQQCVAILAGGNDFYDKNFPPRDEFVSKYLEFIFLIRKVRGNHVPIYLFQSGPNCCSSCGSPSVHPKDDPWAVESSQILNEYMNHLMTSVKDQNVFYHQINLSLDLNSDYAIMMHWSESGHRKIAKSMAEFIRSNKLGVLTDNNS